VQHIDQIKQYKKICFSYFSSSSNYYAVIFLISVSLYVTINQSNNLSNEFNKLLLFVTTVYFKFFLRNSMHFSIERL